MNTHRFPVSLLTATAFTLVLVAAARAAEEPTTIKFSDPAKPGRLEIKLGQGDLRIAGTDAAEVTVKSEAKAVSKTPRKDGLRVISSSSSYVLGEKDNVITLDAMADGWKGGGTFHIAVPRATAVVVKNSWGGDITCTGVAGNLELNCMNGTIRLDEITGGVVASTMNGEIRASFRELREGSPVSFTSMNGEVLLRLPADARASVRLRTQNGSVLTDFDEAALVTKAENTPGARTIRAWSPRVGTKIITADVQEAIRDAAQTSAVAVREVIEAVKESVAAARDGVEAARLAQAEARRSVEAAPTAPTAPAAPGTPKPPAVPKVPTIPTISGGKLVTGTLNGGGPEISVSTMNGDVTLRKLEVKK